MPLVTIADLHRCPPHEVSARIADAKKLSVLYDEFVNQQDVSVRSCRIGTKDSRPAGIHASELHPCLRKPYYTVIEHPKRDLVPKRWRQKFKVGHALHHMLESDFHAMAAWTYLLRAAKAFASGARLYLEFQSEVVLSPEIQPVAAQLGIHSRCDGLFTFREHPYGPVVLRVLVEIKTESPDEYSKLKEPKAEHVEQVHVYMKALDVPLVWFVYFGKGTENNTPSEPPYLMPFDERVWTRVEQKCLLVREHVRRGAPPARVETIQCEWCPYAWDCQPNYLMRGQRHAPLAPIRSLRSS